MSGGNGLPITLTVQEAAARLGLSVWKLRDLCKQGKVPHLLLGRKLLFRQAALDALLDRMEAESVAPRPDPVEAMVAAMRERQR